MCFRRPRRSKTTQFEDGHLPPRLVSTSQAEFVEYHNAIVLEAHLDRQRQISAALEELDTQDLSYEVPLDAIDPNICAWNESPSITITQPQTYKQSSPSTSSNKTSSPPSILLNRDDRLDVFQFGSSKQYDARTLAKLAGSSVPSPKLLPQATRYDILPNRPRPSDPPDLRYENYEIWDKVQKENFEIGGTDLEWKTGVVDFKVEAELLQDYINWVRDCRTDLRTEGALIIAGQIRRGKESIKEYKQTNRKDRKFMGGLEFELRKEIKAVARDTNGWDERWGKEPEDSAVVWDIVERLEREREG